MNYINVTYNVKNNSDMVCAGAIIAFYNSMGRLVKIQATDVTVPRGETQEISAVYELKDRSEEISAKAFVWNSFSEMKPVSSINKEKLTAGSSLVMEGYLFDKESYAAEDSLLSPKDKTPYIKFFEDESFEKSVKYSFSTDFELYVNGVRLEADKNNINKYLVNNRNVYITLIDGDSGGSADGFYDALSLSYYAAAEVSTVNEEEEIIIFSSIEYDGRVSNIHLKSMQYEIYLNGAEAELSQIESGDILLIAFDPNYGLDKTPFYKIYASRDFVTGVCEAFSESQEIIKVDGMSYQLAVSPLFMYLDGLDIGEGYEFILDAFGRVYDYKYKDIISEYGVLEECGGGSISVYTFEGDYKNFEVDYENASVELGTNYYEDKNEAILHFLYSDYDLKIKNPFISRAVRYRVSKESGKIYELEGMDIKRYGEISPYRASENSIGIVRMNNETKIINAQKYIENNEDASYEDLETVSSDSFLNSEIYSAYSYGLRSGNGTYPFVIITYASVPLSESDMTDKESLAVLESCRLRNGTCEATLYDVYRETVTLEFSNETVISGNGSGTEKTLLSREIEDFLKSLIYQNGESGVKNPIENRVVTYVRNKEKKIVSIKIEPVQVSAADRFDKACMSVGAVKMNNDTFVIDAIDYNNSIEEPDSYNLSMADISGFSEDVSIYSVHAFGKQGVDGTYPLVIVTGAKAGITYRTDMAVLTVSPEEDIDENGDKVYRVGAFYQGEEFDITDGKLTAAGNVTVTGANSIEELEEGDVVVFEFNDDKITNISVIVSAESLAISKGNGSEDFLNSIMTTENFMDKINIPENASNWTKEWFSQEGVDGSKKVTRIICGPIIESWQDLLTVANIQYTDEIEVNEFSGGRITYSGLYTDIRKDGGVLYIDADKDTNVYIYDFYYGSSNRLFMGSKGDIRAVRYSDSDLYNGGDFIPWNNVISHGCAFAVIRTVDGLIKDIFIINAY